MNKSRFSVYRIGRGSGVDIQIDDNSVSRVHAELIEIAKRVLLSHRLRQQWGQLCCAETASGDASGKNL